MGMQSSGGA
jgi:hypothetical protein